MSIRWRTVERWAQIIVLIGLTVFAVFFYLSTRPSPGEVAFQQLLDDKSWQELPQGFVVARSPSYSAECFDSGSGSIEEPLLSYAIAPDTAESNVDRLALINHYRSVAERSDWVVLDSTPDPGELLIAHLEVNAVEFTMYFEDDTRAGIETGFYYFAFEPESGTFCPDHS